MKPIAVAAAAVAGVALRKDLMWRASVCPCVSVLGDEAVTSRFVKMGSIFKELSPASQWFMQS